MRVSRLTLFTALVGVLSTPVGVWAGLVLDDSNWSLGVILLGCLMAIDGASVILWINAQKEELTIAK